MFVVIWRWTLIRIGSTPGMRPCVKGGKGVHCPETIVLSRGGGGLAPTLFLCPVFYLLGPRDFCMCGDFWFLIFVPSPENGYCTPFPPWSKH